MDEEGAAEEGQGGPSGDEDAQPVGHVVQVEESGGGDVRAEGGGQRDEEPGPRRTGRGAVGLEGSQATPGSDQEQVDADGVGPGFPAVLSGRMGDVVEVSEGQGTGDHGLHEHGVEAKCAHRGPPSLGVGAGRSG